LHEITLGLSISDSAQLGVVFQPAAVSSAPYCHTRLNTGIKQFDHRAKGFQRPNPQEKVGNGEVNNLITSNGKN
jgi:hypothetical protein